MVTGNWIEAFFSVIMAELLDILLRILTQINLMTLQFNLI